MILATNQLWHRAFELRQPGTEIHLSRLQASYQRFWDNACVLAGQIQKDLPTLTIHDEVHFDSLWERASEIAGPDLLLNPLEAFILGGAILLHDAANTVAAFENGISDIEKTP